MFRWFDLRQSELVVLNYGLVPMFPMDSFVFQPCPCIKMPKQMVCLSPCCLFPSVEAEPYTKEVFVPMSHPSCSNPWTEFVRKEWSQGYTSTSMFSSPRKQKLWDGVATGSKQVKRIWGNEHLLLFGH